MDRHYGLDWLRIGAFGLLIFYHIGMFFVPWDWHVKTAQPLDWVAVPMLATNSWRIPLLFAVSGYATRAVLLKSKSKAGFARDRTARLLVPTIVAMLLVIPPQPWAEFVFKHGYAHSFPHFLTHDYFRFEEIYGVVVPTWQHLWFVVYLWAYTMTLALAAAVTGSMQGFAERVDKMLSGVGLYLVPLGWLLLGALAVFPDTESTHALVDDPAGHWAYLPHFLFGFLLGGATRIWATIRASWKWAAGGAVLAYLCVAAIAVAWPGNTPLPEGWIPIYAAVRLVQGWCAVIAMIGIADRYWNRDHPWRATLTEAVFPFYIIHQTIIVLFGWWLLRFVLGPAAEFALIFSATVAGCWLFYDIGRRIAPLRPLIGLRAKPGLAHRAA